MNQAKFRGKINSRVLNFAIYVQTFKTVLYILITQKVIQDRVLTFLTHR